MKHISRDEFNAIVNESGLKILKYGLPNQPKVYEKDSDTIIKLFYRKKKWMSSDRIIPRAMRFCRNINSLRDRGYTVPTVLDIKYCTHSRMHVVYYTKVAGEDTRSLAKKGNIAIIEEVAKMVADLHDKGVFFRSIHLENLLYQAKDKFALIDLAGVRFKSGPLSTLLRYRNLRHLLGEPDDRELWLAFGVDKFLKLYFQHAKLSNTAEKVITYLIKRNVKLDEVAA